jgi:hypothetical protein
VVGSSATKEAPVIPNRAWTCRWTAKSSFLLALLCLIAFSFPSSALPQRLGDLDEDGQATVLDLVRLIGHINGATQLSGALLPYGDLNEDGTINQADVVLIENAILGLAALPNPFAAPVVQAPVTATNGTTVLISGVSRPGRRILVTGGRFAAFANADSNGFFSVTVNLRPNELNNLFVTASSSNFVAGIPQPLRILQDSQPPNLYLDFPTNGQTLYTSNTVIAGRVGDMLSGFMGLAVTLISQPSATNPISANVNVGIGNNGTFERSNIPLAPGANLITVTASDMFGNATNRQITIHYSPITNSPRLELVSGDLQATNVHRRLAQPIIIRALGADGVTPLADRLVTLEVTRSDGRLRPVDASALANPSAFTNDVTRTIHGVMQLQLFTDANGLARAWWALGGDAGRGNNRVCAMSEGISNAVYFCASARPAVPTQINIGTGNNQKAETGGFVSEPLRAWVNDSCNGNEGMPVTFTIIQGGGKLFPSPGGGQGEGGSSLTILSSRTGHAEVLLQLGPDAGQNIIEATYPGNPALPATFIAYGVARDPSQPTRLSGLVLDNTSCPIGGAECSVSVGGQMFFTATDAQGQFHFTNTPAGPAQLRVDGATATQLLGALIPSNSFPSLEFSLILIPNAENSLPSPVLLPRLNLNNQRLYYGTNDLVLTCEGMEGLKMTIKAGSMRKPDGSLVTPANPAVVSLNQVHHDNVPMPIPDGASPPFAWTLQPGGATFDPPITIEYPNMSGLPAGSVAYFLSFNHDTRRFEIIASGHVTDDSSTIVTDPGAGLSIAGWGCNCPPYAISGKCVNPTVFPKAPEIYLLANHPKDFVVLRVEPPNGNFHWRFDGTPLGSLSNPSGAACTFKATTPGRRSLELLRDGQVIWTKPVEVLSLTTRNQWGARPPNLASLDPMTGIIALTLHHKGEPDSSGNQCPDYGGVALRCIQNAHMDENGWADIGYHFVMDKNNALFEARQLEGIFGNGIFTLGSQVLGRNFEAGIGLCLLGDYETEAVDLNQQRALEKAMTALCRRYGLVSSQLTYHSQLAGDMRPCPGQNIKAKFDEIVEHVMENLK